MAFRPRIRAFRLPVLAAGLALTALAACRAGGDAKDAAVAQVGDAKITVEQVADHMVSRGFGVNRQDVAKAVDELIDLEIVKQHARERYRLTRGDSLQIREWNDVLLTNQFRDDVIWRDVRPEAQEVRAWYDEHVSEEARARHILVSVSPTAGEEERRKARQEADSLFDAIKKGVDFSAIAREHSDDPGSAEQGGLLSWFRRGQMVEPFEKAVYEGKVGALYPRIVETQFGYHIIKVEERRKPSFEDLKDDIEGQLAAPQRTEAERAYVTRLMENSAVDFNEGNIDRFIAILDAAPPRPPSAEERGLDLATYRAGEITIGEIWDLYETLPPNNQRAIEALDQTQMVQALASLVQQNLLLADAQAKKVTLDTTRQRQLDERIDALHLTSYMEDVARAQLEFPDPVVRQYYDEHREFYRDQPFEQVREQIRQVLINQRVQQLGDPATQQKLLEAVADSFESRYRTVRHENRYGDVLDRLREKYEAMGRDPDAVGSRREDAGAAARQRGQGS